MKLILLAFLVEFTVAVFIDCDFNNDSDGKYTCSVSGDLETDDFENFITEIGGKHLEGKSNDDVKKISIANKKVQYFPGGLSNFFPNLQAITVRNSKLKYVFKDDLAGLSKLEYFDVLENNIEILGPKLFEDNPLLEKIHFEKNKISAISDDLLDYSNVKLKIVHLFDNKCIKKDLDFPTNDISASDIKKLIQEKCQMKNKELAEFVDKQLGKLKNRIENLQEQLVDVVKKASEDKLPSKTSIKEIENSKMQIEKLTFDKKNLKIKLSVASLTLEENEKVIKNLTEEKSSLEKALTAKTFIEKELKASNSELESDVEEKSVKIKNLSSELQKTIEEKTKIEKSSGNKISSLTSVNNELKKQITFSSANDAHYETLKARYLKDNLQTEKPLESSTKPSRKINIIGF